MSSFVNWLERRDPVRRWAQQYAAAYSDPVVLRRVQRDMEDNEKRQRKVLGLKRDRSDENADGAYELQENKNPVRTCGVRTGLRNSQAGENC